MYSDTSFQKLTQGNHAKETAFEAENLMHLHPLFGSEQLLQKGDRKVKCSSGKEESVLCSINPPKNLFIVTVLIHSVAFSSAEVSQQFLPQLCKAIIFLIIFVCLDVDLFASSRSEKPIFAQACRDSCTSSILCVRARLLPTTILLCKLSFQF